MQMSDRYLAAVRRQVATVRHPGEMGDKTREHLLYCERVLGYLAVAGRDAMTADQATACRALLPGLRAALAGDGAVADFEAALAAADSARIATATQALLRALMPRGDAASQALVRQIGDLELARQSSFSAALEQELAAANEAAHVDEGLTPAQREQLTGVLRARFPADPALRIARVKAIPGGFSKQTIFLDLEGAGSLPSAVVLRIDKADSPVETTVADEYEIIEAMYAAGVPVPRPLLLETDKAILGGAFVVVGRVAGNAAGDAFTVLDPRPVFGITLAQGLARMHAVPLDAVSDRVPGARQSARERMLGDIDTFEQKWRASGIASVTLEQAYGWLRANIAHAEGGRRAIVHRDVGCHNLLVEEARLTAILDWETALVGDSAQDIGYVRHTVTQTMPWEDFLAEYERAGGQRPTPESIHFYRIWRHVWLMTMQSQARAAIEAGYTLDIGLVYNVLNLFQRLSLSLQELLCESDRR